MYQKSFIISNNDVDTKFQLKVSAIFRLFQDVALLATEDAKVDSISLSRRNIDWVITRMSVEIKRLPKCDEEIIVHTYPGKDMAMLYPRYFFITDTKGEVIIRSSSIWALIDNNTRKVIVDREVISKLAVHILAEGQRALLTVHHLIRTVRILAPLHPIHHVQRVAVQHRRDDSLLLLLAVDELALVLGADVEESIIAADALLVIVHVTFRYLSDGHFYLLDCHHKVLGCLLRIKILL